MLFLAQNVSPNQQGLVLIKTTTYNVNLSTAPFKRILIGFSVYNQL